MIFGLLARGLRSIFGYLTEKPPVAVFITFIAGLAVSCLALAFYFSRDTGIVDYEATKVGI